jgi:dTDP-4-amino-4,6-dideoxygalactose transaminase
MHGKEFYDRNDEILTTPFTFTATGDAILRSGATPVFADIDPRSFNLDPEEVRTYVESAKIRGARVRGIIPVHLYGKPCRMDALMEIARAHGLFVIEDAAQAFGACRNGRPVGALGDAAALSFFPSKNLGGFGDGGMVATHRREVADMVRMLVKHGGKDKYNVEHIGYNARLDTLQAAVLLAKLPYLEDLNRKRREVAKFYSEAFSGIEELVRPSEEQGDLHAYHQYTIRAAGVRNALQDHLAAQSIASMVYYPLCLHKMKVFEGRARLHGNLAHAERAAAEVLSLPMEPLMSPAEQDAVASAVASFFTARA